MAPFSFLLHGENVRAAVGSDPLLHRHLRHWTGVMLAGHRIPRGLSESSRLTGCPTSLTDILDSESQGRQRQPPTPPAGRRDGATQGGWSPIQAANIRSRRT